MSDCENASAANRTPWVFWLLGLALVAYVAGSTSYRDNLWGADAWEHHRAIANLMHDPWHPDNPTLASAAPSIRYSPYALGLAGLARLMGVDAYAIQSFAAVLNTTLLVLAVWFVLGSFGERRAAPAALFVMVSLYGEPPGYSTSYALADLPWMQVNPSAWAFALVIFAWALLKRGADHDWLWPSLPLLSALLMISALDHGTTAAVGLIGLVAVALTLRSEHRAPALTVVGAAAALAFALSLAWPWFSMWGAFTSGRDRDYWFNPYILQKALISWTGPALLCSLAVATIKPRALSRAFLAAAATSFALGMAAFLLQSPTLQRLPQQAIFFLHLPIAVFLTERRVLSVASWPGRVRALREGGSAAALPALEIAIAALTLALLTPQILSAVREPHLLRAPIARLLHRPNKQQNIKRRLDALLAPVSRHDVVLSDLLTSWPVPSSAGRIVAAIHFEMFVDNQPQRVRDAEAFFSGATADERRAVLQRYGVRWVLLNTERASGPVSAALQHDYRTVARDKELILLDAQS